MKKLRKVVSLTALLSFCLLIVTSIILYIVPAGRVAYWANWRLWGLSKSQWGDLHINLGVLLLIAMALHVYLNWSPLVAYMKNKAKELKIFTRDFNVALVITLMVVAGTYSGVPPFSTVIDISEAVKDAAAVKYGEPPYGHAELSSLKQFAAKMGWDPDESVSRLKQNKIQVDGPQQTLQAISDAHGVSPQQIYLAMKPARKETSANQLPEMPPPGIGRRTLADICNEYQLIIPTLIRKLGDQKITATAPLSIKEIAARHNMAPQDLYDLIRRLVNSRQD